MHETNVGLDIPKFDRNSKVEKRNISKGLRINLKIFTHQAQENLFFQYK